MRNTLKRKVAVVLVVVLVMSILPTNRLSMVQAAENYGISNPRVKNGVTTWDCIYFGNYWQEDTNGDGTADKNDAKTPIKWRVLSVNGDDAFLLADKGLDYKSWEGLRTWLGGEFFSLAFSETEQAAVITTKANGGKNPIYDDYNYNLNYKVGLASIDEITSLSYGFSDDYDSSVSREAEITEYAKAQGASVDTKVGDGKNGTWWLRTAGMSFLEYSKIGSNGACWLNGSYAQANYAVRPILHLDLLQKSNWTYAGTLTKSMDGRTAEIIHSGVDGDLNWSIDTDRVLRVEGNGDYEGIDVKAYYGGSSLVHAPAWCEYSYMVRSAIIDVKGITSTAGFLYGCRNMLNIDLSKLDTSNVTNMSKMFAGCLSIPNLDLSGFDTSKVTDMSEMFQMTSYLGVGLKRIEIKDFNTSCVTNMKAMFAGCRRLSNLDLSGFDTSHVTDMNSTFYSCNLTTWNLNGWDTSNVTDMADMFCAAIGLTNEIINKLVTKNVTDMSGMFRLCEDLESIDMEGLDTSQVTDMSWMFEGCENLKNVKLSGVDTSRVTDMSRMFSECNNLSSLDLRGFITNKLEKVDFFVNDCTRLQQICIAENFTQEIDLPCTTEQAEWEDEDKVLRKRTIANLSSPMIYTRDESYIVPVPTPTPIPTQRPSEIPVVSTSPEPSMSPEPGVTGSPTASMKPMTTPAAKPSEIPAVSASPESTLTPKPTSSAVPNVTQSPSTRIQPLATPTNNPIGTPNLSDNVKTPTQVQGLTAKTKKNALHLKWKKISGASGYEVQYSTTKKFKKKTKKTTSKPTYTIKKLKRKKTYFVKVRAYAVKEGKKVYGKWSSVKKVKMK